MGLPTAGKPMMKPFAFWVEFVDMTETTYFFYCIIVANSALEAKDWGNSQCSKLLEHGDAEYLENTWIENIFDEIVGSKRKGIEWRQWVKDVSTHKNSYHFGTASDVDGTTINGIIKSEKNQTAQEAWSEFLTRHHPSFIPETCNFINAPVVEFGAPINW